MKIHSLLPKAITAALGATLWLICNVSQATIRVQLQDPNWSFVLRNAQPLTADMQPHSHEHAFVQTVQPLLAAEQYDQVITAFTQRPLENDSFALQLLRGQVLLTLKNLPDAEKALQAALRRAPNSAQVHRSLSMVYMLQKEYNAAQRHLVRTIELGSADAQSYGQLAFINLQQSHPHSAVAGYQQALFLQPNNVQWQQGLIYAFTQARAYQQAQALVEQMLETTPNDSRLWLLRSQIALQEQRNTDALNSLEVALRLGNQDGENLTVAAQLHLRHGSIERAVTLFSDNVKKLNEHNRDTLLPSIEQAAAWLAYQQQWQPLNKLLKTLDDHAPQIPTTMASRFAVYRAQYALHQGEQPQAQKWLSKAIAQDPSNGEALLSLAQVHHSNKNYEQASLYFIRAQSFDNVRERALLGHAQLEIDREHYLPALALLRKAFHQNPERSDIAGNIRALEKLVRHSDAG